MEHDRSVTAGLKLRLRESLRAAIEAAALEHDRSMNAEMVARLESTFQNQSALDAAMDLAFGPQMAAVAMLLARVMLKASEWANSASDQVQGDWLSDPYVFSQTRQAVDRALAVLKPPGDVVIPPSLGRDSATLGSHVANVLMAAAAGEAEAPGPLKSWGDKTYARLGQQIAARITVKLDEDLGQPTRKRPAQASSLCASGLGPVVIERIKR